jgi:hypothetical protein
VRWHVLCVRVWVAVQDGYHLLICGLVEIQVMCSNSPEAFGCAQADHHISHMLLLQLSYSVR